nr:MAG TPA: hypothetical protein [Caudoviricetes sp.]
MIPSAYSPWRSVQEGIHYERTLQLVVTEDFPWLSSIPRL